MINMPIRIPKIAIWPTSPSYERGKSSSKLIKIMIPATKAREIDRVVAVKKGLRIAIPMSAPAGSAIPDSSEYQNALFLLFVA